jgi:hypothetical protein
MFKANVLTSMFLGLESARTCDNEWVKRKYNNIIKKGLFFPF